MKLLIVDDDKVSTHITTWVANKSGIFEDVRSVSNGREALDIFQLVNNNKLAAPDFILLDLDMPVMNGFAFIESIRGLTFPNRNNMSIVVLTSSANPGDIQRARSLGIEHYLVKPLKLNHLQNAFFSLYRKTHLRSNNITVNDCV